MIFLHHASASWAHSWPEFTEVMGIACDWGQPLRVRGVDHPKSGYFQNTKQRITVVDKAHPITQGLGDGFEIVDESYNCPILEDSVHPLLRTDFTPKDVALNLNPRSKFSNLAALVKTAENSPIVYIQLGHDRHGVGEPGVPHAARQRDSMGGLARRDGVGEEESEEDFQELRKGAKVYPLPLTPAEREHTMHATLLKRLMVVAVGGLFVASAASTQLAGQRRAQAAQSAGAPAAPAARGGRGGGGIPQGGRGPIKVMVVTKGHTYDREPFFQMWDSWGSDITWSHVEHPAGRRDALAEIQQAFRRLRVLRYRRARHWQPCRPAAAGEHSARIVQDREQPVLSAAVRAVEDRVPEAPARGQRVRLPAPRVGGMDAHLARILRGRRRRLRLVCAAARAGHRPSRIMAISG